MELILLRHAKSSWEHEDLDDFDRPLSEKGINDCRTVSGYINERKIYPDLIISSPAKRAKETINLIFKDNLNKVKIIYSDDLYLSGVNKIIKLISKTDDGIKRLMIAGHNPDMELLAEKITGKEFPFEKFSTSGLAFLEMDIKSWNEIKSKKGKLTLFMTPEFIKKK